MFIYSIYALQMAIRGRSSPTEERELVHGENVDDYGSCSSDSESEHDDEFLNEELPSFTEKANIKWTRRQGVFKEINQEPFVQMIVSNQANPLDYFLKYLPDEFFDEAAAFTNIYGAENERKAVQKELSASHFPKRKRQSFKPATSNEIRTVFALHIFMGILKYPRIKMYWRSGIAPIIIRKSMSCDRFLELRRALHFVDESLVVSKTDKMYKVRPMLDYIRNRMLPLPLEKKLCVGEQMIPYKGSLNLKQYMKNKAPKLPNWGVKVYVMCGASGIAYDFIVYQGSTSEINKEMIKQFGFGASVVLHLCKRIPTTNLGHSMYFDHFFTTYGLLEVLRDRSIAAAGTVRINRMANPPFRDDKDMKKAGRGTSDEVFSKDEKIVLTKWYDNHPVHLASNYIGVQPVSIVTKFDKVQRTQVSFSQPAVVRDYNQSMGGVDHLDHMVSYYRTFLKSRDWNLRMVTHFLELAVTCSWLENRADAKHNDQPFPDMLDFRLQLSEDLIAHRANIVQTAPVPRRSDRPPTRYDGIGHYATFDHDSQHAQRCKMSNCKSKVSTKCIKCNVHLCIKRNANHFLAFHTR